MGPGVKEINGLISLDEKLAEQYVNDFVHYLQVIYNTNLVKPIGISAVEVDGKMCTHGYSFEVNQHSLTRKFILTVTPMVYHPVGCQCPECVKITHPIGCQCEQCRP